NAGRDEAVRVILIAGSGDHFCAGFDIVGRNEPGGKKPRAGSIQRRLPSQAHRLIPLLLTVQTPVVCAARGWAAGIGLHLLLAADVALVADDARLWEPFSERGFTPDSGGTWLLPRRVGEVRARELLVLGRALTGTEAADWGLVHRAVATDSVAGEAEQLAQQLANGPTVTLGLTKSCRWRGGRRPCTVVRPPSGRFGRDRSTRSGTPCSAAPAWSYRRGQLRTEASVSLRTLPEQSTPSCGPTTSAASTRSGSTWPHLRCSPTAP